jgi:cytokinin trans-hydroxylase
MGVVPYGKDLLEVMLSAIDENRENDMKNKKHEFRLQALVDECKIFLVGTETLALVFTWTLLLLAEYPEWQECA